jgi:hypothetical protein
MKATVVKTFNDSKAKRVYAAKTEWEGTKARFEEINAHKSGPFLKEAGEIKEAKTATETKERKVKTETK